MGDVVTIQDWFRHWLARRLGMGIDGTRLEQSLEIIGRPPQGSSAESADRWWDERASSPDLWSKLVDATTNNESSFFREPPFFTFFESELRRRREDGRVPISVLSAGCAAGQEIYSCAIVGHRVFGPRFAESLELFGVDIDRTVVRRARQGRYRAWDMRGLTDAVRERWFERLGAGEYRLKHELRDHVTFRCRNVLTPWAAELHGFFDIVIFRNVLVHFAAEARERALAALRDLVRPGGVFALSSTETPNVAEAPFVREEFGSYFFFRRPAISSPAPLSGALDPMSCHPGSVVAEALYPPSFRRPIASSTAACPAHETFVSTIDIRPDGLAVESCFQRFSEGDFDGALACCAAVRRSHSSSAVDEGMTWVVEGLIHATRHDPVQALQALDRGACLCPLSWLAHFQRAESLVRLGRPFEAEEAYRRAIRCLDRSDQVPVDRWYLGDLPRDTMANVCRHRLSSVHTARGH